MVIAHFHNNKHHYLLALAMTLITYLLYCPKAHAELDLGIGITANVYKEDTPTAFGAIGRAGVKEFPVYLWGSLDSQKRNILGQNLGKMKVLGFGLGYSHDFGKLSTFVEAGWGLVNINTVSEIVEEVTYTALLQNHDVSGRDIPFQQCYNSSNCNRGYDYEMESGAFVGRIGLAYQVSKHFTVSAAYRAMKVGEYYSVYDLDRKANGTGFWEESNVVDLGTFEFGIEFKF